MKAMKVTKKESTENSLTVFALRIYKLGRLDYTQDDQTVAETNRSNIKNIIECP